MSLNDFREAPVAALLEAICSFFLVVCPALNFDLVQQLNVAHVADTNKGAPRKVKFHHS